MSGRTINWLNPPKKYLKTTKIFFKTTKIYNLTLIYYFVNKSQLSRLFATWNILISWLLCEVTFEEVFVCITSLPSSYRDEFQNFCWYCWGGGSFPYRLLRCCILSQNNLWPASCRGKYCFSARDVISFFTNDWLPAIPTISIFIIFINKRGSYSVFPWHQDSWYTKG